MSNINWVEQEDTEEEVKFENKASFPVNAEGISLHIRATDPYGFLKVFTDKGPTPHELTGSWTDLTMAKASVQKYIAKNVAAAKFNEKGVPARVKKTVARPVVKEKVEETLLTTGTPVDTITKNTSVDIKPAAL